MELEEAGLIKQLNLSKHPEGGYFRELYRSNELIPQSNLPSRYSGARSISTSIYFMLTKNDVSKFHRIKSDEIWHFYLGDPLDIYVINNNGELKVLRLGNDFGKGETPQIIIEKNQWFGAKTSANSFSLLGCTVAPGFDFEDFELAERGTLLSDYPHLEKVIKEFT